MLFFRFAIIDLLLLMQVSYMLVYMPRQFFGISRPHRLHNNLYVS